MPEEEKQEKKVEHDVKEEENKVVLKVDMHCEGCKGRVRKALKDIVGPADIDLNLSEKKVTVNGKMDAQKVFEAVKKKFGNRTLLLFPEAPKEEEKKDEKKEESKAQPNEPPPITTLELKVKMHCGACAKDIKKRLLKIDGVVEVNEDLLSGKVVMKGKGLDGEKVCAKLRKAGKHCHIVPPPEPPKEEEKKEEKKEGVENGEKNGENKEEKKDEGNNNSIKLEVRRYVYPPHHGIIVEYMYPPQLFSDENPNACNIM